MSEKIEKDETVEHKINKRLHRKIEKIGINDINALNFICSGC